MSEVDLTELLDLAGDAADWGNQMASYFRDKPGGQHFRPKFQKYHLERVRYFASRRPLNHRDYGGCSCGPTCAEGWESSPECSYHLAARLQPWNHRIPWACGHYYDGCNCEGGPFYDAPPGTFEEDQ